MPAAYDPASLDIFISFKYPDLDGFTPWSAPATVDQHKNILRIKWVDINDNELPPGVKMCKQSDCSDIEMTLDLSGVTTMKLFDVP